MAQHVVQNWPSESLLGKRILSVLHRAIHKRSVCHEWFINSSEVADDHGEDNTKHAFFIRQLQEVSVMLQGLYDSQATRRSECEQVRIKKAHSIKDLRESFKQSTLEDMPTASDDDGDSGEQEEVPVVVEFVSNKVKRAIARDPTTRYVPERFSEGEDLVFAVEEWLKLKREVHAEIRDVWTRYKHRVTALLVATITTNAALEILRQAEEKMTERFPQFDGDYEKTIMLHIKATGKRLARLQMNDKTGEFDGVILEMLHDTMYFVFNYLRVCRDLIAEGRRDGKFCGHDAISNEDLLLLGEGRMAFAQEQYLHSAVVVPLVCRTSETLSYLEPKKNIEIWHPDEFTRGVSEMSLTGKISSWFVFATQVQLDIHVILGPAVANGLEDLRSTRCRILESTSNFEKFLQKQRGSKSLTEVVEANADQLSHLKRYCDKPDVIETVGGPRFRKSKFNGLRQHPMWCGILQYNLLTLVQGVEIWFDVSLRLLLPLIYLYDAARTLRSDIEAWRDVDHILDGQGVEYIFYGGRPDSVESYWKKLCLINGFTTTSRAPKVKKERARRLKGRCTLLFNLLADRYCVPEFSLLGKTLERKQLGVENVDMILSYLSDPRYHDKKLKRDDRGHTDIDFIKKQNYPPRSAPNLLRALQNQMMCELPHLLFDYYTILQHAFTFFDGIFDSCKECLSPLERKEASHPENKYILVCKILLIWKLAVESQTSAPGRKTVSHEIDLPILNAIEEALQQTIARSGDVGIRTVHAVEPSLSKHEDIPVRDQKVTGANPVSPEKCCRNVAEIYVLLTDKSNELTQREKAVLKLITPLFREFWRAATGN